MSCLVQCTNDACKSIAPAVSRMITITESKILLSDRLLVRYILAVTTTSVVLQLISITKSINQFFNFYSSLCKKSYQAGSVDLPLKSDKKQFQIITSSLSCQSEKKNHFLAEDNLIFRGLPSTGAMVIVSILNGFFFGNFRLKY